ncbi:MAG: PD-(D/E)XK motif protein [Blastocatellales bacterium]
MNSDEDPWADILPAGGFAGRIERRADPDHPVDFYRARLPDGRYLFILKGVREIPETRMPVLAGMEIRREEQPDKSHELVLELADNEQVSLFRALTHDFLEATADLQARASDLAAQRLMIRLDRWQAMLRRRRDGLLSRQAIIGLTGELQFLRDRLLPALGVEQTLRAWRGPHRDEQDFAHGEFIFEVKTQLSTQDQYLLISSEAQLDEASGRIAVCHLTLVSSPPDDDVALSLNMLVAELRATCASHSLMAQDLLDAGLMAVGYVTRVEYGEERWKLVRTRIFEVAGDFPRLVPTRLPPGVSNVSYRITLGACESFERTMEWLEEAIRGRS